MIVDDSMVARAVLSRMVETDDSFEIAAVAGSAEDAIDALHEVRVDIVLLDLEMPGAGGLKSIPRIIRAGAGAKVQHPSRFVHDQRDQDVEDRGRVGWPLPVGGYDAGIGELCAVLGAEVVRFRSQSILTRPGSSEPVFLARQG